MAANNAVEIAYTDLPDSAPTSTQLTNEGKYILDDDPGNVFVESGLAEFVGLLATTVVRVDGEARCIGASN